MWLRNWASKNRRSHGALLLVAGLCLGAWGLAAARDRSSSFHVRAYPLQVREPRSGNNNSFYGDVVVATFDPRGWREWERRGMFHASDDQTDRVVGAPGDAGVQMRDGEVGALVMVLTHAPQATQLALDSITCRGDNLTFAFSEWFDDPGLPDPLTNDGPLPYRAYHAWLIVLPEARAPFARPWPGSPSAAVGLTTQLRQHNRASSRPPTSVEQDVSCSQ